MHAACQLHVSQCVDIVAQAQHAGYRTDCDTEYWDLLRKEPTWRFANMEIVAVGQVPQTGDLFASWNGPGQPLTWDKVPDVKDDAEVPPLGDQEPLYLRTIAAHAQWSCKHRRLDTDKQCPVCAFMGRRVTS